MRSRLFIAATYRLYPFESKRAATMRRELTASFAALRRLKRPVGAGAVICLVDEPVPLGADTVALPVAAL